MADCPSCKGPLHEHAARLSCGRCGGLMLAWHDVERAIYERAGARPDIELLGERAGTRSCPRCQQLMTTLRVRVAVTGELVTPSPELDRCAEHGIWFDGTELTQVLDRIRNRAKSDDDDEGGDPGGTGIGPGWS